MGWSHLPASVPAPEFFEEPDKAATARLNAQITAVLQFRQQADATMEQLAQAYTNDPAVDRRPGFGAMLDALEAETSTRSLLVGYFVTFRESLQAAIVPMQGRLEKMEAGVRKKLDIPPCVLTPRSVLECMPGYLRDAVELAWLRGLDHNDGPRNNDEALEQLRGQVDGLRVQIAGEGKRLSDLAEFRRKDASLPGPAPTVMQQRAAEHRQLAGVFRGEN